MLSTKKIRTGVIGAGYMGSLHCKAYSQIELCDFAGIYDPADKTAKDSASKYKVVRFGSIRELLESVDAVSIAVPTTLHFMIAKECIQKGVNILMEKPIAAGIDEAAGTIKMLEGRGLVFALGYIERFNPAVLKLFELLKGKTIKSFEAERLAAPAPSANEGRGIF
ncbi:MAG: Gfo/Idh/MocA family oxidoreductase, partial [Candidatus Margulisiibacteriota bacterium]